MHAGAVRAEQLPQVCDAALLPPHHRQDAQQPQGAAAGRVAPLPRLHGPRVASGLSARGCGAAVGAALYADPCGCRPNAQRRSRGCRCAAGACCNVRCRPPPLPAPPLADPGDCGADARRDAPLVQRVPVGGAAAAGGRHHGCAGADGRCRRAGWCSRVGQGSEPGCRAAGLPGCCCWTALQVRAGWGLGGAQVKGRSGRGGLCCAAPGERRSCWWRCCRRLRGTRTGTSRPHLHIPLRLVKPRPCPVPQSTSSTTAAREAAPTPTSSPRWPSCTRWVSQGGR